MPFASWRQPLAHALHRNRSLPYARYVQLATVRPDGHPANRTIVFRGFLNDTNQLKFVTDSRSDKRSQILTQPWGEICWYFPKTREQFRLLGFLTLVDAEFADSTLLQARTQQWQDLSDAARSQFAWPHPSHPKADADAFHSSAPDVSNPLPNFCLLLLNPTQVDHLELRGDPQNRYLYQLEQPDGDTSNEEENWSVQAVNP